MESGEIYYDIKNNSVDYFCCPICAEKVCIKPQCYPQICSHCGTKFGILR